MFSGMTKGIATLLALALVVPVFAKECDELPPAQLTHYKDLEAKKNAAAKPAEEAARNIVKFLPTFKTAVDGYYNALVAIRQHQESKPQADGHALGFIPTMSDAEKRKLKDWNTAEDALYARKREAFANVNAVVATLGNDSYGIFEARPGQLANQVTDRLAVLKGEGDAAAAEYRRLFDFIEKPHDDKGEAKDTEDAYATFKQPSGHSGLLNAAYEASKAYDAADKALHDYNRVCQQGGILASIPALQGREDDAKKIDEHKNDPREQPNRTTASPAAPASPRAPGRRPTRRGGDESMSSMTGDTHSGSGSPAPAGSPAASPAPASPRTASSPAASPAPSPASSPASPASPAAPAAPKTYVVKKDDNLSTIARQLAPSLGNPPIQELVNALYKNINSRSKDNPNLIFPGDTIDLEKVRKDIKAG